MKTFFSAVGRVVNLMLMILFVAACWLVPISCAARAGHRAPDVAAAQVTTDVVKAATVLQNEVNRLTAASVLPVPLGQKITDANRVVGQKGAQLSSALKAYHAATALADRSAKAAEVQALIAELSQPLSAMLGVKLPEGAAQSVVRLIGAVMQAVGAVQAEVAKGLSGARWLPSLGVLA